jgi:hypothetical protein
MEWLYAILGVTLMLAALGYGGWMMGKLGRKGWKDHLWVWAEVLESVVFIAIMTGATIGVEIVRFGLTDSVWVFACWGLILAVFPVAAYTIGRLLGIWHRSRSRGSLS